MGIDVVVPDQDTLVAEIVGVCRRGLMHPELPPCPALRRILRIEENVSDLIAAPMIRAGVLEAANDLPPDHRLVFYESSGAWPGAPLGREKRLVAAALAANISTRTARRWSEEIAPRQIAAKLLTDTDTVVQRASFAITRLHARLDLSLPSPVIILERTIRVLAPAMPAFFEEVTIPYLRVGQPAWREVLGCTVDKVVSLGHGMWGVTHRFPEQLHSGSTHTFSTSLKLPNHASLHPEIGFRPHNTTLNAQISIQFGKRLPSRIESFETTGPPGGVPGAHVTNRMRPDHGLQRFMFPDIKLGYAVGVRWFMDD